MAFEEWLTTVALSFWKYPLVTLIVLLESLPFIGLLIPGQTLVMIAGFAAHENVFDLRILILLVTFAAIIGDCVNYFVGRIYGLSFLKKWGRYFLFNDSNVKKTEKIITHHLGKSLILGHLYSFTRAIAPFLAGAHHIPFPRFFVLNTLGAFLWAVVFVLIGYFAGESYRYIERYTGILFLIIFTGVVAWYALSFLWNGKHKIISKESVVLWILGIASFLFFLNIVRNLSRQGIWERMDKAVAQSVLSSKDSIITFFSQILDTLFDPITLWIISFFLFITLFLRSRKKEAIFFALVMSIFSLLLTWIKSLIGRSRPLPALTEATGYSFPSGHMVMATLFLGLLLYFSWKNFTSRSWNISFTILSFLLLLFIGASRIYLNVHWLSDVVAGFALGICFLTLSLLSWNAWERLYSSK